jgi:hypothetical protein
MDNGAWAPIFCLQISYHQLVAPVSCTLLFLILSPLLFGPAHCLRFVHHHSCHFILSLFGCLGVVDVVSSCCFRIYIISCHLFKFVSLLVTLEVSFLFLSHITSKILCCLALLVRLFLLRLTLYQQQLGKVPRHIPSSEFASPCHLLFSSYPGHFMLPCLIAFDLTHRLSPAACRLSLVSLSASPHSRLPARSPLLFSLEVWINI